MAPSKLRPPPVTYGPLRLYPARWEAQLDGEVLALTPTEFSILYVLASSPDSAVTHDKLVRHCIIKGRGARTVAVHIYGLRRKLGKHRRLVVKVFGVGYRIASLGTRPTRRGVRRRG